MRMFLRGLFSADSIAAYTIVPLKLKHVGSLANILDTTNFAGNEINEAIVIKTKTMVDVIKLFVYKTLKCSPLLLPHFCPVLTKRCNFQKNLSYIVFLDTAWT